MSNNELASSLFILFHKLREVQRSGWLQCNIKASRVESVADHIYQCQMLAYAMYSEYDYDIDIQKVILMLAIHEIGETIIGDITPRDMDPKLKSEYEKKAVTELLSLIPNCGLLNELFDEFELKETNEAKFAYQIDKCECDLQCQLYAQNNFFDDKNLNYRWINNDLRRITYDDNFRSLLEYVLDNGIEVKEHSNSPIDNVLSFYSLTNVLKNTQRTGEVIWKIKKEHYGSIAEHIYSVQMLAVIIFIVYGIDVDIKRVVNLLSIHEIGEIKLGDISALVKTDEDRVNEEKYAQSILGILSNSKLLIELLNEFNQCNSKESICSKYCDKLGPDIISKIYDQLGYIDLNNQEGNPFLNNPIVKKYIELKKSFSDMWMLYGQDVYKYPEPYISLSKHVLNNRINEHFTERVEKSMNNKKSK